MVFRPEQGIFRVGGWTAGVGGLVFVAGGLAAIFKDGLAGLIPMGVGFGFVYLGWHILNRHGYYDEIELNGDWVMLRKNGLEKRVSVFKLEKIGEEIDGEGWKFMELRFRGEYLIRFEPSHDARVFMSALAEATGVSIKKVM
jgi:hypothetical protein